MRKEQERELKYVGVQSAENVEDVEVIVSINQDTYHELRYLLAFAAEQHETYCHIEDAVHLRDTLISSMKTALEECELID